MTSQMIDVGIDIGMRRIAYGWPEWEVADSLDLKKPGVSRDWELRTLQRWLVQRIPPTVQLWIDQAFLQASVSTTQRLTETIAAVMTAQDWEHPPILAHSSTWKAQVVGNSKADKVQLQEWLVSNRPDLARRCKTEDEYDAMIIGLYGEGRSRGEILPPAPKKPKRRKAKQG